MDGENKLNGKISLNCNKVAYELPGMDGRNKLDRKIYLYSNEVTYDLPGMDGRNKLDKKISLYCNEVAYELRRMDGINKLDVKICIAMWLLLNCLKWKLICIKVTSYLHCGLFLWIVFTFQCHNTLPLHYSGQWIE